MAKNSLVAITRDLVLAKNEYEMFEDESLQENIDELVIDRYKKEDGIYFFYNDIGNEIELFKKQMNKAKGYIKFLENQQERMKQYVVECYAATGDTPKHSALNPIKVSESSGAVDILCEEDIPGEYWIKKITHVLDKKRILEDLKSGKEIQGVMLKKSKYVRGIK